MATDLYVDLGYWPGTLMTIWYCGRCAVLTADREIHDTWHRENIVAERTF